MPKDVVSIAWYLRSQWDRVREVSLDRNEMPLAFDDWLKGAEDTAEEFRDTCEVHRINIDVDMLVAWAARKGLDINGETRTAYANHLVALHFGMTDDV